MSTDEQTITIPVKLLKDISDLLWDAKSHLAMHMRLSSENLRASQERVPFRPLLPFPPQIQLGDEVLAQLRKTVDFLNDLLTPTTETPKEN